MSFNVWFQPTANKYAKMIEDYDVVDWSVASEASEGDIVLIYQAKPDFGFIKDIFRITTPVTHEKANWKSGMDWGAPMRRVCKLASPVRWEDLRAHPHLNTAGFVRGSMRGRYRATEYWPILYDMILARNPSATRALAPYGPDGIAY